MRQLLPSLQAYEIFLNTKTRDVQCSQVAWLLSGLLQPLSDRVGVVRLDESSWCGDAIVNCVIVERECHIHAHTHTHTHTQFIDGTHWPYQSRDGSVSGDTSL